MTDAEGALDRLRRCIRAVSPLSADSWSLLLPALQVLEVKRGSCLLGEGTRCDALFFISRGCCRTCYNRDGLNVNTGFYFEDDFVTNTASLITGAAAEYSIHAHEPSAVVRIDKAKLLAAYAQSAEIERFGRKMLERLLAWQEEDAHRFRLFSAQQRYEYLEAHRPDMIRRISLTQLASFLGISREALSRIRRRRIPG